MELVENRGALVTQQLGERIIRRTVSHLPVLLANIEVFQQVLKKRVGSSAPSRFPLTHGTLLAGAHFLTSLKVIDAEGASAWLDAQQWAWEPDAEGGNAPGLSEGRDCLQHLLSFRPPGAEHKTVGQLVLKIRNLGKQASRNEVEILGTHGLKAEADQGLYVLNSGPAIEKVFRGSKWRDGGHRARLMELPQVIRCPNPERFSVIGSKRCVLVPWETTGLDGGETEPVPIPAAPMPEEPVKA